MHIPRTRDTILSLRARLWPTIRVLRIGLRTAALGSKYDPQDYYTNGTLQYALGRRLLLLRGMEKCQP